jgi:hypothetical protein
MPVAERVAVLIEHASINMINSEGRTPLIVAAAKAMRMVLRWRC